MFKDRIFTIGLHILLITGLIMPGMTIHARDGENTSYYANRDSAAYNWRHGESYEDYSDRRSAVQEKRSGARTNRTAVKEDRAKKTKNTGKTGTVSSTRFTQYRVRKGDTLYSIARKFSVPVDTIQDSNNLKNSNALRVGMTLRVPVKKSINSVPERKPVQTRKKANGNTSAKPSFRWPLAHVVRYDRDGMEGVKSIGLIITGRKGAPVLSSAAGTVEKIGYMRGYGRYIVVTHGDNYITVYANLENISVTEGQVIISGKILGRIDSDSQKIHFQIDYDGKPTDPLRHLPRKS